MDRSVKRVKSYSKWSKLLLEVVSFHSISNKILLFLQSDPLFYSIWSNYFFTVYGSSDLKRRKSLTWCAFWKLEQLWKGLHIPIATKVQLFNAICVTILLYGYESWVISQDMENKINAFATSRYRVMLNIKCSDHVLNTTVYSITNTVPLIHLVRHRHLKFLDHILRMSKEEPARRYALYIPTIGKRRPGRPRISYLTYVQRLLGDNEGARTADCRTC